MGLSGGKERPDPREGPERAHSVPADIPQLYYFGTPDGPAPGRAELTRLAFATSGIQFKDVLVPFAMPPSEEWLKLKAEGPPSKCFGSMPVVVHGQAILAQSQALALYAATLGDGTLLQRPYHLGLDMMAVGVHADLQDAMYACMFGSDESKAKGKEELPGKIKPLLGGLERMLSRHPGAYLYAKTPSLGDLAIFDAVTSPFPGLTTLGVDLTDWPKVQACVAAATADPYVAAYKAGTPKTDRRPAQQHPDDGRLPPAGWRVPVELHYFKMPTGPAPGRAELTRLALAASGQAFVDKGVTFADWPGVKSDPESAAAQCFGSMPVVQHGDVLLAQSKATALYAASVGLFPRLGDQKVANLGLDMMAVGAHADVQKAEYDCLFGSDEAKAAGKEALPGKIKPLLDGLEQMLGRNGGAFLYSTEGPTLGDLAIFDLATSPFPGLKDLGVLDLDDNITYDRDEPYPKIKANVVATRADTNVGAYCKKRGF